MTKLEQLRQTVAQLFENATEKDEIERLAKVNNSIDEVAAEQAELTEKNAELIKSYKELVKHTSFKEQPKKEVEQVEKELPKKIESKKEVPKKTVKESPKKEQPKKKEQNDNIDPETGLAKVKDGTHLEEEAKKQEEEGIIEPEEEYNEEDDEDWIREYGNTDEVDDYSEENEYN